jgi:hypothetical protein
MDATAHGQHPVMVAFATIEGMGFLVMGAKLNDQDLF